MYKIAAATSLILVVAALLFFAPPKAKNTLVSPLASGKPSVLSDLRELQYTPEPLSIERIFSHDRTWIATLSADHVRTMIATGDVIPARSVNFQALKYNDFTWPYLHTADLLKSADVTFVNLETPLLRTCPTTNEGMIFCGDARHVQGLQFAGVDIASVANNHAGNHGEKGVDETEEILSSASIRTTGREKPLLYPLRGITMAFLAYNDISAPQPGVANADDERIKNDIAAARKQADIVIVSYHWGVEYRAQPDDRQVYLGHLTIDAGADLVIGNHPHWIQPVELYKGKLITYAHGNFVFDQMWSQKTREGVVGRYTFYDSQLIDVEYIPISIDDYGQATYPDTQSSRRMLEEMKKETIILQQNRKI